MKRASTQHNFFQEYPVLTSLALIHTYPPRPLIDVLENPRSIMVNKRLSHDLWSEQIGALYHPLYQFLLDHEIRIATIITGNFLDFVARHHPKFLDILRRMIDKKLMYLVADAYWGTSHLSLFYVDWWKDEIDGTQSSITTHLGIEAEAVYLPLVYRGLPLERLTSDRPTRRFVSTKNQKKTIHHTTKLRDFRRYHGNKVTWIDEDDNVDIELLFYPDKVFFHMMRPKVSLDAQSLMKAMSMEIGLKSSRVDADMKRPSLQRVGVRIPEERPLNHYHVLQQSTIRLWEYATYLLGKEHVEEESIDNDPLMRNLYYMMHRDFLFYLDPSQYTSKRQMPFSSPYEAFVHVQNVVFQLERLLQKRR